MGRIKGPDKAKFNVKLFIVMAVIHNVHFLTLRWQ